jgi:hypothetical protein
MGCLRFAEESEYATVTGFQIGDGGGDGNLDLCTRPRFAPKIQLRANQFRALADARQAPMSGARAPLEHSSVNAYAVIADP